MKFNLLFFIRILLRHLWLLIAAPILLASLVFFLTKNETKVYESKVRIFTGFASGSSIELNTRLDFKATNIAYDNLLNLIKSKTTLETVSLKLLAQHLSLDSAEVRTISKAKYDRLMEIVPEDVKQLVVKDDLDKTFKNLKEYKEASALNFINELLNLNHPDYGYQKILDRITIRRISSSDFIDISFQSEDAAICQNTLAILTDTFIKENAKIQQDQSDIVVKYFEDQLARTTTRLNTAEKELLEFNRDNLIMNYYEQSKLIAGRKETFELRYQTVFQNFHSSQAVLETLEAKMATHDQKRAQNATILGIRDSLSQVNYKISMNSLSLDMDSISKQKINRQNTELFKTRAELELALSQAIDTLFVVNNDKSGLASTSILKDWLQQAIIFEGSKAELAALDVKRLEFDEIYKTYAPLGAILKKLERKINIEEKEYLSLLHSLGLAKLKQQNGQLKANLTISEPPFFPIEPQPSKRMMLVIVAGMAGFVIVTFTVIVLEFLDGNINTAKRAESIVGLGVSSIYPVINPKDKAIDYDYLKNKAINAISRNIILNQFKASGGENKGPVVNMFFSTQENEGKSFLCRQLIEKLCELDYKILHVTYENDAANAPDSHYRQLTYEVSDRLYRLSNIEEFNPDGAIANFNTYDFVILELPSIIKNPFPVKLAALIDYTFMVTRANRPWSEADKNALMLFNQATTGPEPTIILNGVKVIEMETVIDEVPRKRSRLRRIIKKLVQFRFFTKQAIG